MNILSIVIIVLLIYVISSLNKITEENEYLKQLAHESNSTTNKILSYLYELQETLEDNPILNPGKAAAREKFLKDLNKNPNKEKETGAQEVNKSYLWKKNKKHSAFTTCGHCGWEEKIENEDLKESKCSKCLMVMKFNN